MSIDLRPLIELHFVDQKISALQARISAMPIEIHELDRKIERLHRGLDEKKESMAACQKKRRELESDLTLVETKRNRYKEQLDAVKTNKEYTALQHEIDGVSVAIRQIEDQILAEMEVGEELKLQLEEAQKAIDKEEGVIVREKNVLQSQTEALQRDMEALRQERQKWVDQIPLPTLEIYDRIAGHRRGVAMAAARNEMCQECHVRIRPQLFQEIKRNDSIITCESCSRILYYPDADKQAEETTTGAGDAVHS